ncbi:MAG: 37-kD nucleoid-associated bacterial protein [Bacteroidetes bacterium OLB9]|nr:MAG: 37-kD nucleoid-associated bacterial protein [Bacteroidetes bacterium OLB9]
MINYIQTQLEALTVHFIGNQIEGEDVKFSPSLLQIKDSELYDTLLKYFLTHFKEPEFFRFTFSSDEVELNPVYNFIANIFDDPACLYEESVKIARHLFEKSRHPNIKSGELFVVYFTDLFVDDEMVDGVGIFKSENKDVFIKVGNDFSLQRLEGSNIGKLDKGCIIFNTGRDNGFKICNIDHSNRFKEAQYWRDDFLILTPLSDEYFQTKSYIQATKSFIKNRMSREFDTDSADEAAVMNRSQNYFKNNEKFDTFEYEQKVFKDDKVIEAFQDYKEEYQQIKALSFDDVFDISPSAVKRQSRVFRSVIKLDKNFHIYVHGDKNKIQKGTDEEGRKYYILYYDEEN